MDVKLAEVNLLNGQDDIIIALEENVFCTVGRLADLLGVTQSTVSKMVERLFERGLARRVAGRTNARTRLITITPQGLEQRLVVIAMREKIEADLTAKTTSEEIARMTKALGEINDILSRQLAWLR